MEQQNQNLQVEEGVSLMDIIRLLLGKIRLLIVVVLIGGILGGSFAIWRTVDVNQFGTKIEFYVNPEKPEESTGTAPGTAAGGSQYGVYGAYGRHVMDNMVKLLGSDSFAERLLLNGEALPDTETQWFGEEEETKDGELKNDILLQLIEDAQIPLQEVADAEAVYNAALTTKAEAVKSYTKAETNLTTTWRTLYQKGEIISNSSSFNEKAYQDLDSRPEELKDAYGFYVDAQNNVTQKTTDALNAEEAWKLAKKRATEGDDSPVEKALNFWRKSAIYTSQLKFYKKAVSYSYLEDNIDFDDANNLARSFIYVKISIVNKDPDQGFIVGDMILERVKKVVPMYVEENMTVPDGYSGTNCQRITRTDDIRLLNPGYTTTQAIKYGILVAAAAFVIAAVIIIIMDKSDKRLRDTEIITRKFNVPLLGIVPTIEELKMDSVAKKKTDKTGGIN